MMGGCRGVAGKPAAFARTQDANLSSSAPQYGYLSTPHPRVPLHVIRAYMDRQGCTPRWVGGRIAGPAAPTPPSDLGAAGKSMQRPRARGIGVWMGSESPGWRRTWPTRFPCHSSASPRSSRAIAERVDYKSRLQALFYLLMVVSQIYA